MMDNNKRFLDHTDVECYQTSFALSNVVWEIVLTWKYFAQETVGKQFVRSVDSISANIAEGFGRYFKKDKVKFYRYSMGSLKESQDWLEKARVRKLINDNDYTRVKGEMDKLPKQINSLIKFTNDKLSI